MRFFRRLINAQQAHVVLTSLWTEIKPYLLAGHSLEVSVKPATRSTEQNALLWAVLGEISDQVVWHGQKLSSEDWKHVLSASLRKQRVAPGIDGGGFVVLGQSTSRMTKAEFSELLELAFAFGAQHDVKFSVGEEVAA